jgi:hypothetical protein
VPKFLTTLDFVSSQAYHSLFLYGQASSSLFVLVYVDDISVTGRDTKIIEWFITRIKYMFPIHDLGYINYFLGIEVTRTPTGYVLCHSQYIEDLLQATCLQASNGCSMPMATTPNLSKNMVSRLSSVHQYRQVAGALQYLTLTRSDIFFNVNKLVQFMHCATDVHWQAYKRLLRYLRRTSTCGLLLSAESNHQLHYYSDSDWAGYPDDRCSTGHPRSNQLLHTPVLRVNTKH